MLYKTLYWNSFILNVGNPVVIIISARQISCFFNFNRYIKCFINPLRTVRVRVKRYFTTDGLPPISSSWRQASWGSRPESFLFLQLSPYGHSPCVTSSLTRRWACLLWICLAVVKCTYRTYSMLSKIIPFTIYTSPLSVQALQSRSCLSYLPYAITAA
jgi:hypothetical protein